MTHRLDPLLRPRSVAVVGASARADSLGEWSLKNLLKGGFERPIYPVNPRYEKLQGLRCFRSLADLPAVPDLVVFGVGDQRIEAVLSEAIDIGIGAAVIMSTLVLDNDTTPNLRARVLEKIRAAGLPVCGSNGMGFYNVRDRVWACGFDSRLHEPPGAISLISHSGAGMSGLIDCDERLRINLAVSTGDELSVTMDEYLDFALDLPETRVVGLFMETARNPRGLRAALEKAVARRIPIVALKVGRTAESARLAVSHSGALAGDDGTYDALFDRYGVQRVSDLDELATTLIMFAEMPLPAAGGLVTLHDSGGERQLLVDLADRARVPLARLSDDTVGALEKVLDPELPAINPLDAWSRGGPDARRQMTDSLVLMLADPAAAMGAAVLDRAPDGRIYGSYVEYLRNAHAATGKPVALVSSRQGTGSDERVAESTRAGLPVLDGVSAFLTGVKAMFSYRDFLATEPAAADAGTPDCLPFWKQRLQGGAILSEQESLALLGDFGLATIASALVGDVDEALAAAERLGYPVALKTARSGAWHKTELGGVALGLHDDAALRSAYEDMSARLGHAALIAAMAEPGAEMLLGARRDAQFGPVVIIGIGGAHAELLEDVVFLLPPFTAEHARRRVDRLKLRGLLDGPRGQEPVNTEAFCQFAAAFSQVAYCLRDVVQEIDINPVVVGKTGCVAVDALIAGYRGS